MRYPLDKIFITQYWGENPETYKRFGLRGHNGLDFRASNRTKVYAPHSGKILEATTDPNGYGLYLKIQNEKEGSVLGHLDVVLVVVGDSVKEGDFVAYSDNTGFSTGPHLHWGYYKIPRNRNDGYLGFINQLPLLEGENMPNSDLEECLRLHKELVDKCNEKDKTISSQATELTKSATEIKKLIKQAEEAQASFENADRLRSDWYNKYKSLKETYELMQESNKNLQDKVDNYNKDHVPQTKIFKKVYDFILKLDKITFS